MSTYGDLKDLEFMVSSCYLLNVVIVIVDRSVSSKW